MNSFYFTKIEDIKNKNTEFYKRANKLQDEFAILREKYHGEKRLNLNVQFIIINSKLDSIHYICQHITEPLTDKFIKYSQDTFRLIDLSLNLLEESTKSVSHPVLGKYYNKDIQTKSI